MKMPAMCPMTGPRMRPSAYKPIALPRCSGAQMSPSDQQDNGHYSFQFGARIPDSASDKRKRSLQFSFLIHATHPGFCCTKWCSLFGISANCNSFPRIDLQRFSGGVEARPALDRV